MINGLGDKLQKLRTQFNMSQKEVAVAINTSPSIILYHCSTDYLLGFQSNNNDNILDVSMLSIEQKILLQQFLASINQ